MRLATFRFQVIIACAQGKAFSSKNTVCLDRKTEKNVRKKILQYRNEKEVNVKILDYKIYSRSCVLIDTNGDFISQSWNKNDCIVVGNVFDDNIESLWSNTGCFDHTIHLLQYLRHPVLYK